MGKGDQGAFLGRNAEGREERGEVGLVCIVS